MVFSWGCSCESARFSRVPQEGRAPVRQRTSACALNYIRVHAQVHEYVYALAYDMFTHPQNRKNSLSACYPFVHRTISLTTTTRACVRDYVFACALTCREA